MALGCGQNACGFAIGFSEVTVCGTHDKTSCRIAVLHPLEQRCKLFRSKGEILSKCCKVPASQRFRRNNLEQQSGNQHFCLLVPMRLARHSRFVEHECVGKRAGIFRNIEAVGIEHGQGIES
jgi:hypothetical protein